MRKLSLTSLVLTGLLSACGVPPDAGEQNSSTDVVVTSSDKSGEEAGYSASCYGGYAGGGWWTYKTMVYSAYCRTMTCRAGTALNGGKPFPAGTSLYLGDMYQGEAYMSSCLWTGIKLPSGQWCYMWAGAFGITDPKSCP